MNTRNIKTKRPWKRIKPIGYLNGGEYAYSDEPSVMDETLMFGIVTQGDFLREYHPSGHRINDPSYYPDIFKEESVPVLDITLIACGEKVLLL